MNEVEIRVATTDDTAKGARSAETRLRRLGTTAKGILGGAGVAAGALFAKGLHDNMNIEVATDNLQGQLNLTTDQAKKAGAAAGAVYANNWGDSIDEVDAAIKSVGTNIGNVGNMAPKDLEKITTAALAISQTFDVDVNDSTRAAGALMKNGLAKDATQAFDLITAGMQQGLDKSGDFMDTLNEYSPQFHKLGIDGPTAIGLLSQFLKAGARDTDSAADAFKEFSIRSIDGSKLTMGAYKDLGLNGKAMGEQIGKGGDSAVKGLDTIIQKLQAMKDPVEQNRLGTALFGTQWEDTVREILPRIDITESAIEGVDGATQKMADTVGDNAAGKIETFKRKMEQWTQSMSSSNSAMGTLVTGVIAFGGPVAGSITQIATMAAAMKGTALAEKAMTAATLIANGALKAMKFAMIAATGPVGLIILGVAALAAGLIYAYKKSEKFRAVVDFVFKAAADVILGQISAIIGVFEKMFGVLSHLPGKAGRAFKSAQNAAHAAKGKVDELRRSIDRIHSKKVTIRVNTIEAVYGNKGGHYEGGTFVPNKRTGGVVGAAATGGVRGGWTLTGEEGPELARLAPGTSVRSHGDSMRMLAAGMGQQGPRVVLEIKSGGARIDDLLVELLRRAIRVRGGDASLVLSS